MSTLAASQCVLLQPCDDRVTLSHCEHATLASQWQAESFLFPPFVPRRRARVIQKGTRVLISLWDSLMFGRVPKNDAPCVVASQY